MEKKVLAVVEGKEITDEIVNKFIQDLGPQMSAEFNHPAGQRRVVEELVNQELAFLDAKEKNLENDEEFVEQFELMKEGLLKQYAISKILEGIEVSDEEAKKYFGEHPEYFTKPATVKASHILVDSEEKANDIKKEIEEGLDFGEAAMKYSSCPSNQNGGQLGEFGRGQMVPEFEEAAFKLALEVISEPVQTTHGFHLIKVTDKNEEGTLDFEQVKDNLKNQLIAMKQQEKYIESTNKLKEKYNVEINI